MKNIVLRQCRIPRLLDLLRGRSSIVHRALVPRRKREDGPTVHHPDTRNGVVEMELVLDDEVRLEAIRRSSERGLGTMLPGRQPAGT